MSSPSDLLKERLIDLRRQRELYSLQNHGLRRSVPCGLLLRGREHARHPPGRMHRLRGLRAGMPGRRDQARHRAGAREMAVAECGIRENLAKYYGQKSAPARLQGVGGEAGQTPILLAKSRRG